MCRRALRHAAQVADRDLYEVLGVDSDASDAQLRVAYRRLARELHPDVNPDPQAQARFAELSKAYKTLSDSEARAEYDRSRSVLQAGTVADTAAQMDLGDVLSGLMDKPAKKPRKPWRWPWAKVPTANTLDDDQ